MAAELYKPIIIRKLIERGIVKTVKSAKKIVAARKFGKIYSYQIKRLGIAYNRAKFFMTCADDTYSQKDYLPTQIKSLILNTSKSKYLKNQPNQLNLFD